VDDAAIGVDRQRRVGLLKGIVSMPEEKPFMTVTFAQDQLRSVVERIERLEEEKQAIADDIKEVYAEAKGNGFDTKILRTVVRLRKQDTAERQEQEALLDLYMHALGMAPTTAEAAE
jgi:uncharacterized protein (UPF0335 family)